MKRFTTGWHSRTSSVRLSTIRSKMHRWDVNALRMYAMPVVLCLGYALTCICERKMAESHVWFLPAFVSISRLRLVRTQLSLCHPVAPFPIRTWAEIMFLTLYNFFWDASILWIFSVVEIMICRGDLTDIWAKIKWLNISDWNGAAPGISWPVFFFQKIN